MRTVKKLVLIIVGAAAGLLPLVPHGYGAAKETKTPARDSAIRVSVDPRVELICLIFRLAGNPEYGRGALRLYVRDVEKQFGPRRNHPVVRLAASLREKRGVSFDAPMSLAVHLTDASTLKPKVPLWPRPQGLDGRWPEKETQEFLEQARRFVKETEFDEFFRAHQPLYDDATSRMKALLAKEFRLEWFEKFFGDRPGAEFHVVLGMLNGPSCYGAGLKVGDADELYCILGVWKTDWLFGTPQFDRSMLPTIVHEFCHSYANPLVDRHAAALQAAGESIFSRVKARMRQMAYGNWRTMMYESLVRACVIRYMAAESPPAAEKEALSDQGRGFLWIKGLADLLGQYESDRKTYPTLESFFPRIVEFFDSYSKSSP
jgi:hypothetical protein